MSTGLPESCLLHIQKDVIIDAPLSIAWEALLEQMGPAATSMQGPMPMKFEPWPGGRWFRDLGNNTGHLWGHVQVIKPPNLLEITGPLFMSYAAVSHVQYRLSEEGRGTRLSLFHRALGEIASEHRDGANKGWQHILEQVRERAHARK